MKVALTHAEAPASVCTNKHSTTGVVERVKEIGEIFEVSDRVVYKWIDNFNENGVIGLLTHKGQGRKSILQEEHKELVQEYVEKYPFQLSTVCSELLNDGIKVSKKSLKHFLKSWDIPINEQELQSQNKIKL